MKSCHTLNLGFFRQLSLIPTFFVALIYIFLLSSPNVYSGDTTLTWDSNTEPDLARYRICCREEPTSHNYNIPFREETHTTCTTYNTDNNASYYFVARAFDSTDGQSGNSGEVCYQPDILPTVNELMATTGEDTFVNIPLIGKVSLAVRFSGRQELSYSHTQHILSIKLCINLN